MKLLIKRLSSKKKQGGTEMSSFVISQVKAANEPGWFGFLIGMLFNATVISEHDGAAKSGNGGIWKTTGRNPISPTCPVKCSRRPVDNYCPRQSGSAPGDRGLSPSYFEQ